MPDQSLDKQAYQQWQIDQAVEVVMTPMDKISDYAKYVLKSYLYARSRLFVPGRCYEPLVPGPLAAGSNAHADIMDLDTWLAQQPEEDHRTVMDFMNDTSLDDAAYWRGLRHRSTIKRRRDQVIKNFAASTQQTMGSGHRE